MVFHDQQEDIQPAVSKLNQELSYLNLDNLCIHTGPIIRKEEIYTHMSVNERLRIFNKMVAFIRQIDIHYKCFYKVMPFLLSTFVCTFSPHNSKISGST